MTDSATPVTPEAEPLRTALHRIIDRAYDVNDECRWCGFDIEEDHESGCAALIAAAALVVRAATPDRPEPLTLACGCNAGTHLGTLAAIKEAHPDIQVPGLDVEHWYFRATPDRLAGGLDADIVRDAMLWRAAEAEGHTVDFTESGYGLQHPPSCRPDLIGCRFNRFLAEYGEPVMQPGRYRMAWPNSDDPMPTFDRLSGLAEEKR